MRKRLPIASAAVAVSIAVIVNLADSALRDPARIPVTDDITLLQGPLSGNAVDKVPEGGEFLAETCSTAREIAIGSKTIRLLHPGRGHTDGDLIALFVEDRVVHMGDLFFNRIHPNIDLEAGGSAQAWPATPDAALALPFDQAIPGHGMLSDRAGVRAFATSWPNSPLPGAKPRPQGWSRSDMQRLADMTLDDGCDTPGIPLVMTLDREFVLNRAWEETARDGSAR